jgi:hypothetical protein
MGEKFMNQFAMQLGLDLAGQGATRVTSVTGAARHAGQAQPDWSEMALQAFCRHAETHAQFSTEDVIGASSELPLPPDKRAWGHVVMKAKRLGVCCASHIGKSALAHAHGRWITVWASNIYRHPQ